MRIIGIGIVILHSDHNGDIVLVELTKVNNKICWKYIEYSASTIHNERAIPEDIYPTYYISGNLRDMVTNRLSVEVTEEDFQTPFTEEIWEDLVKRYLND